jgi:hypothetical protein
MLRISSPMGVPVVLPSKVPDRISTSSVSRQVRLAQFHAGRAAIDNAAKRLAVAFSEAGYSEEFTEAVS